MGLGTILRLTGYLIEAPCLLGLVQVRMRAEHAPGPVVESLLYFGIVVGIGLIIAGNIVNARSRRPKDKWDLPRDSP
ncbi:MAG TPA: hypothetical protein VGH33_11080 [Isosphaeraceae bacterium]|jgi:hypothetical protein